MNAVKRTEKIAYKERNINYENFRNSRQSLKIIQTKLPPFLYRNVEVNRHIVAKYIDKENLNREIEKIILEV